MFIDAVSPIMESSPPVSVENINDACKQLTQGIATLTTDEPDPFSNAPFGNTGMGFCNLMQGKILNILFNELTMQCIRL